MKKKQKPKLVLLAEDDPAHATAIQRAVEAGGPEFEVKIVGTLREFRKSSVDRPPNIAVMDLNLPDGRATEVLTCPPEAGQFPILVMTSYGNEQVAVEAIKAGALEYVVKSPEAFAEMPHTITHALHEWNLLQERKQAEEALEFKNIILTTQQEASIDGILVVDENGDIISFNRRFVEIWDIPSAIAESKADEQILKSVTNKLASPGEFVGKLEQLHEDRNEISQDEIALKDGRTFDRYSAPMLGEGGKYYGRVWYFRDITDRKQAEAALRASQERLREIFEASPNVTSVFRMEDRDLRRTWVSPNLTRLFGYTVEEALQQHWWSAHVHPEDLARVITDSGRMLAHEHIVHEYRFLRRDGSVVWIHDELRLLRGATGQPQEVVGAWTDITERKELETHLLRTQRLESVGRLASGIAHDLNNILAPMLMVPPLLREVVKDPELRNMLDLVETNAQRGSNIIKQLLTFGRGMEGERVPVQLRALVSEMSGIIRETFHKNITTRREALTGYLAGERRRHPVAPGPDEPVCQRPRRHARRRHAHP